MRNQTCIRSKKSDDYKHSSFLPFLEKKSTITTLKTRKTDKNKQGWTQKYKFTDWESCVEPECINCVSEQSLVPCSCRAENNGNEIQTFILQLGKLQNESSNIVRCLFLWGKTNVGRTDAYVDMEMWEEPCRSWSYPGLNSHALPPGKVLDTNSGWNPFNHLLRLQEEIKAVGNRVPPCAVDGKVNCCSHSGN